MSSKTIQIVGGIVPQPDWNQTDESQANFIQNKPNDLSNAITQTKSGESIFIDDISSVKHNVNCKIQSKNLCSIGSTGDFKGQKRFDLNTTLPAGVYTISAVVNSNDVNNRGCLMLFYNGLDTVVGVTIPRSTDGERVSVTHKFPKAVNGVRLYCAENNLNSEGDTANFSDIQIEEGVEATEYTPYVDVTTVAVECFGKNLFPIANVECTPVANNNNISYKKINFGCVLPAGTYALSAIVKSNDINAEQCILAFILNNVATTYALINRSVNGERVVVENINIPSNFDGIMFYASNTSPNSSGDVATFTDVQMERGKVATDYEKYIEVQHYTPLSDGIVKNMASVYPNMTVVTDTVGTILNIEYNRDINKAFEEIKNAILSLGGNI